MLKKILSLCFGLLMTACTAAPAGAVILKEVALNDSQTEIAVPEEIRTSIFSLTEEITPDYFASSEKSNQIFSPVSLWYALGVLREGATGETLDELDRLMKLHAGFDSQAVIPGLSRSLNFMEESELHGIGEKGGIRLSNGIFVDEGHRANILDDYLTTAAEVWGAETGVVDFTREADTKETIRKWVAEKTDDFIPDYEASFNDDGSAILNIYNVLYLQDHWHTPFNKLGDQVFHTPEKDITVPYMGDMRYADGYSSTETYRAASFEGEKGIRLWFILPENGEPLSLIPEIRSILDTEPGNGIMLNFKSPIIDIDGENLPMKELLKEKGYTDMFTNASLDNMLQDVDAVVDDIRQKTRLKIDEKGFKAAAVTEIGISETSLPETTDFFVDRPYLVVIEYEGLPLFVSHISDPGEK